MLNELHGWMEKMLPMVPPKSAPGTALSYMRNYWAKLVRYTERGYLPIDNNRCESAIIYSLVETAKANGVEPYTWLRHVLEQLPAARSVDEMDKLLPWNFHAATLTADTTR